MSLVHTFAGNPLDRADPLRRDETKIQAAASHPTSRYLPLWNLSVLVQGTETPHLGWIDCADISRLDIDVAPVLLGLDADVAHFAIDISEIGDPSHELNLPADWRFEDARMAAMSLPAAETGITAQARSQIDWHRRHGFCSVCGARTEQRRGGHQRRCSDCNAEHFPRTDPVAIMLITDGEQCLLGQSAGRLANAGMYSALAGFIDQGESIEEAVRREIREEAGIEVGEVRYHSSQPWPFPSSLMIGCHGQALTRDITIDTTELTDVRWFDRSEVHAAMTKNHPTLRLPGPIAIAHHLIDAWVNDETGGL
ncbi:MAG: NAD(+) diphosphatase [Pseudomonadales bacterium]